MIRNIIEDNIDYSAYYIDLCNIFISSNNINYIIEILNEIYIEHIKLDHNIINDSENMESFLYELFNEIASLDNIKSIHICEGLQDVIMAKYNGKILLECLLENKNIEDLIIIFGSNYVFPCSIKTSDQLFI